MEENEIGEGLGFWARVGGSWVKNYVNICNGIIISLGWYLLLMFDQDGFFYFVQRFHIEKIASKGLAIGLFIVLLGIIGQRFRWYRWMLSVITILFVGAFLWSNIVRFVVGLSL